MPGRKQSAGFAKAVLGGTLTGALPAWVLAAAGVSANLVRGERIADLWLFTVSFGTVIAFGVVLSASLVFGLPLTLAFRRLRWESGRNYMAAGVAIGLLPPLFAALRRGSSLREIVLLGGLCVASGAVTGLLWWRIRARLPTFES